MRNRGFFDRTFDLNRDGKFSTIERIMDIAMYDLMTNDTEDDESETAEEEQIEEQKKLENISEYEFKRIFEDAGLDMEQLADVSKADIIEAFEWSGVGVDALYPADRYTIIEALENYGFYSEEPDEYDEYEDDEELLNEEEYIETPATACNSIETAQYLAMCERLKAMGFDPSELFAMGFEGVMKTLKDADILPSDLLGYTSNQKKPVDEMNLLDKLRTFGLDPAVLSRLNFEDFMGVLKTKGVRPEDLE